MALVSNMSFALHVCWCPTFSVSTPFHLVSVQLTVWHLLPPEDTSLRLASLHMCPSGFDIQLLEHYSSARPLKHSPGAVLINPWPMSRAFKLSSCALKCCLILGFNKLVWSMLVATTFFWKSVGFSILCTSVKLQMGETNPAPSSASLKKNLL